MIFMSVKKIFDAGALQYDQNRRKVIPCFDDFYKTLIRLIAMITCSSTLWIMARLLCPENIT